jgi:hypothetical protein
MGFAAYFGVAWLQPEVITFRGIIAALLVIVGGVLAVAFANPNKKKEIKFWMEEKNPDEPIKNEHIKK